MTATTMQAMDVLDHPLSIAPATRGRSERRLDLDYDRAPGMPLLPFVLGTALSVPLWALIGFTAWALLT